ncbi:hypothetical protein FH972_025934 [Carpinus fangiana]|uniref:Uncharacterized protein n=1 Tax=Carpinus fangiana TaxID=176857 RepID=A0A5N6L2G3_9ROSI|nr:hypothetical protein FH972_025934 [Carpinus fangiana]
MEPGDPPDGWDGDILNEVDLPPHYSQTPPHLPFIGLCDPEIEQDQDFDENADHVSDVDYFDVHLPGDDASSTSQSHDSNSPSPLLPEHASARTADASNADTDRMRGSESLPSTLTTEAMNDTEEGGDVEDMTPPPMKISPFVGGFCQHTRTAFPCIRDPLLNVTLQSDQKNVQIIDDKDGPPRRTGVLITGSKSHSGFLVNDATTGRCLPGRLLGNLGNYRFEKELPHQLRRQGATRKSIVA